MRGLGADNGSWLSSRILLIFLTFEYKVQLVLVMSRDAALYVLDEPIGGVDPAARDYILKTILTNYDLSAYNLPVPL